MRTKLSFGFIVILVLLGCNRNMEVVTLEAISHEAIVPTRPKNIIVMIGDGMGAAQIASNIYGSKTLMNLEQIPDVVVGLHKNEASNALIIDSAAGATAFACGTKTYNAAIGVNADTQEVQTILELAQSKGYKTGLVATSTIVHATPASFAAHNRHRSNYEEIALDMSDSEVDIMIGGGAKFFNRRSIDTLDLYEIMRDRGYQVEDYFSITLTNEMIKRAEKLIYLTADDSPLMASQGRDYLPMASRSTVERLSELAAGNGFFVMIEGSQIDWGGHANNAAYIQSEVKDFDDAIGQVINWAVHDGETLVVITADHETGGYSIMKGSKPDSLVTAFTSDYHTATLIPVFAFGPGSEYFSGIYANTEIYHKIRKALEW